MKRWDFRPRLVSGSATPVFLQLVQAIARDIRDGRLAPGERLPGSRTLARALKLNRNTILAAYGELGAEGWVATRPAGGTFVRPPPPELRSAPRTAPARAGFPLPPAVRHDELETYPPGTLVLARAAPDIRLLPLTELARAYRRALLRHGRSLLFYGDPRGHERLRAALAAMVSATRGIAATADTVLVTRGSQMALDLIARALLARGDVVAIEALGHPIVWSALGATGAELVPLPIDGDGLSIGALARLAGERRVRAVYVTPHHQFPTTAVMPPARRRALLDLAARHRMAIIEDDYDHEFHYDARPILPLASADLAGVVVYVGTLSKILAPGVRLGFAVAPTDVIGRLTGVRAAMDIQGDQAMECAVADLFEEGEVQRHVHRVREVYAARRDALVSALQRELGGVVDCAAPAGGMAVWARAPGVDVDAWAARARARGVAFRSARIYDAAGGSADRMRLAFTFLDEDELADAVRRMATALARRSSAT